MLIKAKAAQAETAGFPLLPAPNNDVADADADRSDARDLEIARLIDRLGELEDALAEQQRDWNDALTKGVREAKEAAAREHVEDEQRRFDVLVETLSDTRLGFESRLHGECAALAQSMALHGFERLVQAGAEEKDWLGRLVARRVGEIAASAIVAIRLPASEYSPTQTNRLRELIPPGTRVELDSDMAPGGARIELQLGEVAIEPAAGAARIAALIAEGIDDA